MSRVEFALLAMSCLALLSAANGCAESSAAIGGSDANGDRFLLAEEPADVMCVCDLREQLPSEETVAVLGRIGGIENPWTEGEASFVMSDPSLISLSEDDHECGDNCKFCKRKKAQQMDSMAFVQIVDGQGRVIRTDARKLLGVTADQMIVVQGAASLNRAGHIVIAATGLYVRE